MPPFRRVGAAREILGRFPAFGHKFLHDGWLHVWTLDDDDHWQSRGRVKVAVPLEAYAILFDFPPNGEPLVASGAFANPWGGVAEPLAARRIEVPVLPR